MPGSPVPGIANVAVEEEALAAAARVDVDPLAEADGGSILLASSRDDVLRELGFADRPWASLSTADLVVMLDTESERLGGRSPDDSRSRSASERRLVDIVTELR